jgi:tRNA(His) 5'-end guanylyltransferase
LTKEVLKLEAPYDVRFRDMMAATVEHLMNVGFQVVYGYTQSDEISLLFALDESLFDRKLRKYESVLAGEASACFALKAGVMASFDCRISQLPNAELVEEYFAWRQEDAARNALNSYCYWTLRKEGKPAKQATNALLSLSVAQKNELLFLRGINFNKVPSWQKRGLGFWWETYEKDGLNPKTGQKTNAIRRRVKVELELPMKEAYRELVKMMAVGKID